VAFDRSDDLVLALEQAATLFADGRFAKIAECTSDAEAALRVTEVADVFVAWLRRPTSLTLTLVSIEEQEPATPSPSQEEL
jgi:hypothetical protein